MIGKTFLRYLMTATACLTLVSLHAQESRPGAAPRLPKGIPRLEEGQANPPSANWLLDAKDDR